MYQGRLVICLVIFLFCLIPTKSAFAFFIKNTATQSIRYNVVYEVSGGATGCGHGYVSAKGRKEIKTGFLRACPGNTSFFVGFHPSGHPPRLCPVSAKGTVTWNGTGCH